MQVIRHQQIITHQPGRCFRPSLAQKLMRRFVVQPRLAILSVDGQKNNVGMAKLDMNPGSGVLALREIFVF